MVSHEQQQEFVDAVMAVPDAFASAAAVDGAVVGALRSLLVQFTQSVRQRRGGNVISSSTMMEEVLGRE